MCSSDLYAYRIGCNIPWTKVDCTVILDPQMANLIASDRSLIDCKIYFSDNAWEHVKDKSVFEDIFLGTIAKTKKGMSSGNMACMKLVELGYKDIDIYGADAMTTSDIRSNNVTKSYTRKFLDSDGINMSPNWRTNWNRMIEQYPDVKFNFIKGNGNVKELR